MKYKVILRTLYEFSNPQQNYYEITLEADLPYRMGGTNCDLLTIRRPVEIGARMAVGSSLSLLRNNKPQIATLFFGQPYHLFKGQSGKFRIIAQAGRIGSLPCNVDVSDLRTNLVYSQRVFMSKLSIGNNSPLIFETPIDLASLTTDSPLQINLPLLAGEEYEIECFHSELAAIDPDECLLSFTFKGKGQGWADMTDEEYIHV
jgi:hypothetical protein